MSSRKTIVPFKSFEGRAPDEKNYVRMTTSQLTSPAYKKLSYSAQSVLLMMKHAAKGKAEFTFSRKQFEEYLGGSAHTYLNAVEQLIKCGFIERCPRCCFSPSKFVFSAKWQDVR